MLAIILKLTFIPSFISVQVSLRLSVIIHQFKFLTYNTYTYLYFLFLSRFTIVIILPSHMGVGMARPAMLQNSYVMSTRLEKDMYQQLTEIAALESSYCGRKVSVQDLVRNSLNFCYRDGERLREVFRMSRYHITKRIPKGC